MGKTFDYAVTDVADEAIMQAADDVAVTCVTLADMGFASVTDGDCHAFEGEAGTGDDTDE